MIPDHHGAYGSRRPYLRASSLADATPLAERRIAGGWCVLLCATLVGDDQGRSDRDRAYSENPWYRTHNAKFNSSRQTLASHRKAVAMDRTHWSTVIVIAVVVLLVLGAVRLVIDTSTTILGTSASCGNVVGYLSGGDAHVSARAMAFCSAPLLNAFVESVMAGVVGLVLVLIGAAEEKRHRPASPGWYSSSPGMLRRWDGSTWTPWERPIDNPDRGGPALGLLVAGVLVAVGTAGRDRAYADGYRAGLAGGRRHRERLVALGIVAAVLVFGRRIHPLVGLVVALAVVVTVRARQKTLSGGYGFTTVDRLLGVDPYR
jgi:hypothetical protein